MKSNNVFLYFRAAYDTVDRRVLWTVLCKRFNFSNSLIATLRTLFDSNQSLLVGNSMLNAISNSGGLLQGSAHFFIDTLICELEEIEKDSKSNSLFKHQRKNANIIRH